MTNSESILIRSAREAAAILGISESRINRFRCEGDGPAYVKMGVGTRARVGYRLADLESWLESCVRFSTSDTGTGK